MSTVSAGSRGGGAPASSCPRASTWSRDFPVLSAGPPSIELEDWELTITSETDEQQRWDWAGFRACPAAGHRRPPLRHPLVQARHHLGGVAGHLLDGLETSASFALVTSTAATPPTCRWRT